MMSADFAGRNATVLYDENPSIVRVTRAETL